MTPKSVKQGLFTFPWPDDWPRGEFGIYIVYNYLKRHPMHDFPAAVPHGVTLSLGRAAYSPDGKIYVEGEIASFFIPSKSIGLLAVIKDNNLPEILQFVKEMQLPTKLIEHGWPTTVTQIVRQGEESYSELANILASDENGGIIAAPILYKLAAMAWQKAEEEQTKQNI